MSQKLAGLSTMALGAARAAATPLAKATTYAARHAASGTLPGQLGLEFMGQKAPLSRRIANAKEQLSTGTQMAASARHGEGLTDPNKTADLDHGDVNMNEDDRRKQIESGLLFSWDSPGQTKEALTGLELAAPFLLAPVVGAAASGVRGLYDTHRANKAWDQVIKENPGLNTKKHRESFSVIKDFSPDIAANPVTLRSELRRMGSYDDIPHEFVGGLASAQDTVGRRSLFNAGLQASVAGLPKMDVGKLDGSSDGKRRAQERARQDTMNARQDATYERGEAARRAAEVEDEIKRRAAFAGYGPSKGGMPGVPNFSVSDLPRSKKAQDEMYGLPGSEIKEAGIAEYVPGTSAFRMRRAVNADAKEPIVHQPVAQHAGGAGSTSMASGMSKTKKVLLGLGAAGALGLGAHALYSRRKAQEAEQEEKFASLDKDATKTAPKYRPVDPSDDDDSMLTQLSRTNPAAIASGIAAGVAGGTLAGPPGAILGATGGYLAGNRLSPDWLKDRNRQTDARHVHSLGMTTGMLGGAGLGAALGGPPGMIAGGVGGMLVGDHMGRGAAQRLVESDAAKTRKKASDELADEMSVFDL